jgi:hypothetical protein
MSDPISGINGLSLASIMAEIDPIDMFGDMPAQPVSPTRSAPLQQADQLTISAQAQMESMRIMSSSNPADIATLRTLMQTEEALTGYPVPLRAAMMPVQIPTASDGPQAKARLQPTPIEVPATTALALKDTRAELIPFPQPQGQAQVVQKTTVDEVEKEAIVLGRTVVPRAIEDVTDDAAWVRGLTRTLKIGVVLTAAIFLLLYIIR